MKLRQLSPALFSILLAFPLFAATYRVDLGGGLSGDADGSGTAIVTIEGTTVSYVMTFQDIGTPTASHIHRGAEDVDGNIVLDLAPDFGANSARGSVTASQALIDEIMAAPGGFYINVHTTDLPGGAIRGQLELVASSPSSLILELSGDAEVPDPGDRNGSGLVTLDFRTDSLDYTIQVENVLNPLAAHIHTGTALEAGPIFVDLMANFTDGIAVGSVPLDSATRMEILAHLEDYYVNVHTPDFPAGALRAQLATEWVLPVVGKVVGVNNTNFVTDVRIVNLSSQPAQVHVEFFPSSLTGLEGPSMTETFTLPPMSLGIADDIVGELFETDGLGAMTFTSSEDLAITGRVINDLRDQGLGTNGLFVDAQAVGDANTSGVFPFLSSASTADVAAGIGFRTNVGFFNPTSEAVELTFTVRESEDGEVLGTVTETVQPFQHRQLGIYQFVTTVPEDQRDHENFYATWSSDGPLFVYAAVTDNETGDAMVLD